VKCETKRDENSSKKVMWMWRMGAGLEGKDFFLKKFFSLGGLAGGVKDS
jgi:hypothetical protein